MKLFLTLFKLNIKLKLSIMKKLFLISVLCIASTAISLAQLKVIANGKVGIGISVPECKLALGGNGWVLGVDNDALFCAKNAAGTYEAYLWPRWSDNIMYLNYGSGGFHIRNNSSATTMFMENNGDVSIGATSSPNHSKLYIYTNTTNGYTVHITSRFHLLFWISCEI